MKNPSAKILGVQEWQKTNQHGVTIKDLEVVIGTSSVRNMMVLGHSLAAYLYRTFGDMLTVDVEVVDYHGCQPLLDGRDIGVRLELHTDEYSRDPKGTRAALERLVSEFQNSNM